MACMKCGKDTADGQTFCARCLAVMEEYPVKPDIHIQLPTRKQEESSKKPGRKSRSARKNTREAKMKKQIRWMWALIALLMLALAASMAREAVIPETKEPGQNYTYTEPTA